MRVLSFVLGLSLLGLLGAGCDGPAMPLDGGVDEGGVIDGGLSDGGPSDGGPSDGGPSDGGALDAALPDPCEVPLPPSPERILFVGNSFTFTASKPSVFEDLVTASGFPAPLVASRAIGGQTLEGHRSDTAPAGAPARVREGWDVVILQEFSTRPTDSVGPAEQFEIDAAWFYDLAVRANPEVRVILYETFARRFNHPIYPGTFDDPLDMQAQLRFHYDDCAERYIPMFSETFALSDVPVEVARVGDAWEAQLATGEPPRLHGDDDYHPSAAGAYLTALVFFGTIYERSTDGLPAIGVDVATAIELQGTADLITGFGRPVPILECPRTLPIGERVGIDFGPLASSWPMHGAISGTSGPVLSLSGMPTDVTVTTRGFVGEQTGGSAVNDLGLPGPVSQDSLWVGSFDSHAAALALDAEIELGGLTEGTYSLELFASRDGDDAGNGRLTRYTVGTETRDLDVADNRARLAVFPEVIVAADGAITVHVGVSPAGTARFGYAGSLVLTRLR